MKLSAQPSAQKSATLVLLLDAARVRIFSSAAPAAPVFEQPWNPDDPEGVVAAARERIGVATRGVLVVGLGLLEIAEPDLPPLATGVRRDLLLRDADRYFPIEGAVAVSATLPFACAVRAPSLARWVDVFDALAPIQAVATIADVAAKAGVDGTFTVDAASGEIGRMVVQNGAVRELRRVVVSAGTPDAAPALSTGTDAPMNFAVLVHAAVALVDAPLDAMLLDDALGRRLRKARQRTVATRALCLVAVLALVAWSANGWRKRELTSADAALRALMVSAQPAQQYEARLQRAQDEATIVANAGPNEAAVVLERLATLLPRDAFIQRLEWDGNLWRIDGSALNAPRIVPALDGDSHFTDVRTVAASARFMDAGQQRESFSIAFGTRASGGSRDRK